jgi:hypothetical protein
MNDLRDLTSTSLIYYEQVMEHLSLINYMLNPEKQFRWNKLSGKLYLDFNWTGQVSVGEFLLIDCYSALDPTTAPKFWNDRYFKEYVTALFKKSWATNIKKYSGITLPGNITLDGQALYEEAKQEIDDIEKLIMDQLSPLEFVVG